ncbi:MAG: hypothetical protein ABI222_18105 [Opitutaceae bacterium]
MASCICTLVEGDYHLGLGVLTNSLLHHGFRGPIWVGYRGSLPPWAAGAKDAGRWHEFAVGSDTVLRFVALTTPAHLTNYKPEFLAQVWEQFQPEAERLFYFDPDIVIKAPWSFFEEWAGYGAALVEDVNSPMPESHPRRCAWVRALGRRGQTVRRETSIYVNGGFLGLHRDHRLFLDDWRRAMALVGEEIGGLENSMFSFGATSSAMQLPSYPYNKTDQDALNIAVMTSAEPVSLMGAEGMDFRPGGWTMSHALGPEKPWRKQYVRAALGGRAPSLADRAFWLHASHPIPVFSASAASWRRRALTIGAAIGRWYRRN